MKRVINAEKKPLRRLSDILDAAEARFAAGKGIPHDEFWRQIEERFGKPTKQKKLRSKAS